VHSKEREFKPDRMITCASYSMPERPNRSREARLKPSSQNLPVEALSGRDEIVKSHFVSPEVQYVGSTSGCGCDFPNVMFQNGGWPYFEDPSVAGGETEASERLNCEKLVSLLQSTGDSSVELYGIWDGDFAKPPASHEEIALASILEPGFRLKERGFYSVLITGS
jgi:hypothetical protein